MRRHCLFWLLFLQLPVRFYIERCLRTSGSIFQAAEVFRDLSLLKENKDLSHGERRLYDQAKNLLIKELSIAKRVDENEIERSISVIFKQIIRSHDDDEEVH